MDFTIRPATRDDLHFLLEMLYESLYVPKGHQPFERDILNNPSISKYLDGWVQVGDFGLIAEDHRNRPLGSITYRFFTEANKGYGYISDDIPELGMAVIEEYRGKGIGTVLLKTLMEAARRNGIRALSLSVHPDNPACRLYKRLGFREVQNEGASIIMKTDL